MDDLSRFCCLNADCPDHGRRGAANLTVTGRYGPERARRMLRCRTCKARFSERKGTPLFDARLPPEKVESVLEHVAEGCGVRQTGRLCRVAPNTVARYSRIAGGHARDLHEELVAISPRTTEVQFDEKWAFVAKKEARCDRTDPADDHKGDYWDHVALDPEHKLVVAVVPGTRTIENTEALIADFRRRTEGRLMNLMTSDDYPAYETAILHAYGETITPPRTGKPGRPKASYQVPPPGLTYATVTKRREKGRVVEVGTRVVFGTVAAVLLALAMSPVSRAINTAFVERQNGTDRHRNARKARKTYRFSKDWRYHEAVTFLSLYAYNFCWPVRTLTQLDDQGRLRKRSPAMAAGLADHVWSMSEWLSFPAVHHC
jgi:IS1 family transposase/transposase-like protein